MGSLKKFTVKDLNPRSQAVKALEMTVVRALNIIKMFDALDKDEDWTDVPNQKMRKVFPFHYAKRREIMEMWKQYQRGTLAQQVLDLYENLPAGLWKGQPDDNPTRAQELKGRRNDIATLRKEADRTGGPRTGNSARRRRGNVTT